jgi:hypothetical protein
MRLLTMRGPVQLRRCHPPAAARLVLLTRDGCAPLRLDVLVRPALPWPRCPDYPPSHPRAAPRLAPSSMRQCFLLPGHACPYVPDCPLCTLSPAVPPCVGAASRPALDAPVLRLAWPRMPTPDYPPPARPSVQPRRTFHFLYHRCTTTSIDGDANGRPVLARRNI